MILAIYFIIGFILVGIALTLFVLNDIREFFLSDLLTFLSILFFWPLHIPYLIATCFFGRPDFDIVLWKRKE